MNPAGVVMNPAFSEIEAQSRRIAHLHRLWYLQLHMSEDGEHESTAS
jgi:hypothetical protein